jgi:hypothetical protein
VLLRLWVEVEELGREREKNKNRRADAEPSRAWARAHRLTVRTLQTECGSARKTRHWPMKSVTVAR